MVLLTQLGYQKHLYIQIYHQSQHIKTLAHLVVHLPHFYKFQPSKNHITFWLRTQFRSFTSFDRSFLINIQMIDYFIIYFYSSIKSLREVICFWWIHQKSCIKIHHSKSLFIDPFSHLTDFWWPSPSRRSTMTLFK